MNSHSYRDELSRWHAHTDTYTHTHTHRCRQLQYPKAETGLGLKLVVHSIKRMNHMNKMFSTNLDSHIWEIADTVVSDFKQLSGLILGTK